MDDALVSEERAGVGGVEGDPDPGEAAPRRAKGEQLEQVASDGRDEQQLGALRLRSLERQYAPALRSTRGSVRARSFMSPQSDQFVTYR